MVNREGIENRPFALTNRLPPGVVPPGSYSFLLNLFLSLLLHGVYITPDTFLSLQGVPWSFQPTLNSSVLHLKLYPAH